MLPAVNKLDGTKAPFSFKAPERNYAAGGGAPVSAKPGSIRARFRRNLFFEQSLQLTRFLVPSWPGAHAVLVPACAAVECAAGPHRPFQALGGQFFVLFHQDRAPADCGRRRAAAIPSRRTLLPRSSARLRSATPWPIRCADARSSAQSAPDERDRIPLRRRRGRRSAPRTVCISLAEVRARIRIFSASVIWASTGAFRLAVERLAAACFSSCRRTAESMPSFCAISWASSSRTIRLGTRWMCGSR